jgi:hypothetical protein
MEAGIWMESSWTECPPPLRDEILKAASKEKPAGVNRRDLNFGRQGQSVLEKNLVVTILARRPQFYLPAVE